MSPKEKAKELFNKYSKGKDSYGWNLCEFDSGSIKCALIAVDEILSLGYSSKSDFKVYDFYSKVKQEIEKL